MVWLILKVFFQYILKIKISYCTENFYTIIWLIWKSKIWICKFVWIFFYFILQPVAGCGPVILRVQLEPLGYQPSPQHSLLSPQPSQGRGRQSRMPRSLKLNLHVLTLTDLVLKIREVDPDPYLFKTMQNMFQKLWLLPSFYSTDEKLRNVGTVSSQFDQVQEFQFLFT